MCEPTHSVAMRCEILIVLALDVIFRQFKAEAHKYLSGVPWQTFLDTVVASLLVTARGTHVVACAL